MGPSISIIVPVYKTERYLCRCIDSILAQTYTDFELLLVDDGSPDNSSKICDEYAALDPRVRVFHKTNGGASSARNQGLAMAKGKWIAFCDSDDWTYPSWLNIFGFENSDRWDLLCQGFRSLKIRNGFEEIKEYGVDFAGDVRTGIQVFSDNNILGYLWNKAFKREIIESNGLSFDENIKFKEDEVFILKYLCFAKNVKSLNDIGYFYYEPDWENKYSKIPFLMEECRRLNSYYSLKFIMGEEKNKVYDAFFSEGVIDFYFKYYYDDLEKRRYCLDQLHFLLKDAAIKPKMFWLTRMAIKSDLYKMIGGSIMQMHRWVKILLRK